MPRQEVTYITIPEAQQGRRLDNFLLTQMKGVPRTHIYTIIRTGQVRINSRRGRADYRLQTDDRIRIPPLRLPEPKSGSPAESLQQQLQDAIFYRDEDLIAINKWHGVSVHGGGLQQFGIIETLNYLLTDDASVETWQLVFRLDRLSSGCLLAVCGSRLKRLVQQHWHDPSCQKIYRVLVHGHWPQEQCTIQSELIKSKQGGEYVMDKPLPGQQGKQAITHFKRLEQLEEHSLLEARLETGRTHQIRNHCASAGHPVLGDDKYLFMADKKQPVTDQSAARQPASGQLALHCYEIVLSDALGLAQQTYSCPCPQPPFPATAETEQPYLAL